ncbi:MAG: AbrB/MazE/SpoVT family DNA-binding domain-containing protein [Candidatus Omnitrophota bacterium]
MVAVIQKWGNSLAVRIPKAVARDIHVGDGVRVDMGVQHGRLWIIPEQKPKYELQALLKGVSRQNVHREVRTGSRSGGEAW